MSGRVDSEPSVHRAISSRCRARSSWPGEKVLDLFPLSLKANVRRAEQTSQSPHEFSLFFFFSPGHARPKMGTKSLGQSRSDPGSLKVSPIRFAACPVTIDVMTPGGSGSAIKQIAMGGVVRRGMDTKGSQKKSGVFHVGGFAVNRYCASLGCGVSDQIQFWTLHRGTLMEDCGPGA